VKIPDVTGYAVRRLALAVPMLLGAATIVFSLIHLIPGDPAEVMLGPGAGAGDVQELRQRLGLDRPLAVQYAAYVTGLLRGDLGVSLSYHDPVGALIAERYPATLLLASASLAIALLISLPAGVAAALRPGGLADRLASIGSVAALSIPSFWLGPLLILLFAIRLDWLPVSGMEDARGILLPSVTLAVGLAALLTRLLRASLVEEMGSVYLRTAYARGLSRPAAALRHALRNALPPVITIAALQLGSLLTGAILTETIFAWPGIGRLLVQAIAHRDYPVVQGCVLLIAVTYLAVNLAADLLHGLLDPRAVA
jgi:ABC-type dipeptide/oligopeptide/nickel transport system permease component